MKVKKNNPVKLILLLFMLQSVVGLQAQVRLGGDTAPNRNAVLDLNANDTDNGSKGLMLPRVALMSTMSSYPLTEHIQAMLVYNTASVNDVFPGPYYNDGTKWVRGVGETTTVTSPLREETIQIGEAISTQSILFHGSITDLGPNTKIINIKGTFSNSEMVNNAFTLSPAIKISDDGETIYWSLQVQNFNFNPTLNSTLENIVITYQCLSGKELEFSYNGTSVLVGW